MFKYDREYLLANAEMAINFFFSFVWRAFICSILCNLVISVPVFSLTEHYTLAYALAMLGNFAGFVLALRWLQSRVPSIADKRAGVLVSMRVLDDASHERPPMSKFLRLGWSLYWRSLIAALVLTWTLGIVLEVALEMAGMSINSDTIIGLVACAVGWIWLTCLTPKTGVYIDFTRHESRDT